VRIGRAPAIRRVLAVWLGALTLACRSTAAVAPPAVVAPSPELAADVAFLAAPALAGRGTGTPGLDSAAAYIGRAHQRLGLAGVFARTCPDGAPCAPTPFQFFDAGGSIGRNIAVVVAGTDSTLRAQYVVVGAHYDHIGRGGRGARDPELGSAVRPGADDNASGSAAVLALARRLATRPPRRSVLLVHFDAEEIGLVGSRVFVKHPPVPLTSIVLMLNLDMVGRLQRQPLTVDAPTSPAQVRVLVEQAARDAGLRPVYSSVLEGRSDHASFAAARIPTVALFTGFHADYHRASDVAARLDLSGLSRIVDVAEAIVRSAADRDGRVDGRRMDGRR
jgi:hypothetical protein